MSDALRRLAAGVVLTGFRDEDLDGEVLGAYPFGGYIVFDRNAASPSALRAVTDRLRGRAGETPP